MLRLGVFALACVVSATGCYSPKIEGCDIQCTPGVTQCPGDLTCSDDGFCRGADDTCDGPPGTVGNLISITTGNHHACALDTAGQLFCWGSNDLGQVTGTPGEPVQVGTKIEIAGVDHWTMVDAGGDHTCGIGIDTDGAGKVYCWGNNQNGQCGQNSPASDPAAQPLPITDARLDAPMFVTAGNAHTCAITTDAQMLCWGANDHGQLGDGTLLGSSDLTLVIGDHTWLDAAAGDQNTCARSTDGEVYCWGRDSSGQIGDGMPAPDQGPEPNPYPTPTKVQLSGLPPGTATHVAVGFEQVCMTYNDPSVGTTIYCWGDNGSGQVGVPTNGTTNNFSSPQATQGLGTAPGWTAISAAGAVSCGITNGSVICWGVQTDVLGDDCDRCRDTITMPGPHLVDAVKIHPKTGETIGTDAFAVSVSEDFGCALYGDPARGGVARCWGSNSHGNLATSGISRIRQATRSIDTSQWKLVRLASRFGCGIKLDGTVWCWGDNSEGQANPLSDASFEPSPVQIDIGGEAGQDLALGDNHACVLYGNTGTTPLLCWGSNAANELGVPGAMTPTVVPDLGHNPGAGEQWTEVHAAANLTCAVLTTISGTDTYTCWGTSSWHSSPTPMVVADMTASGSHLRLGKDTACAIQTGNLLCWGTHDRGLRADGSLVDSGAQFPASLPQTAPAMTIIGLSEAGDIDPAGSHRCAFTADKTYCWGGNGRHQVTTASGDQPFAVARDLTVHPPADDYVRTIASGTEFTIAIDSAGQLRCWGDNTEMQCTRNGPAQSSGDDVAIAIHVEQGQPAPDSFATLAAGESTGCAIAGNGDLYCWGDSARGQTALGAGAADQDFATTIVSQ